MIARLRGTLIHKTPGQILLEVGGVGYEVEIPYTTFFVLPETGSEALIHTQLVVREDSQTLFGFAATADRGLFRLLIKTSGVGPKLALAILSGLSADAFSRVVEENNLAALVKIPGVGKKTAERLLIEMRDRIGQLELAAAPTLAGGEIAPDGPRDTPAEEAESALITLGYKPQEAARAVQQVNEAGMPREVLIRLALKSMIKA
ncbi:MAG: Holliday junction branch migration protein RuvA [Halomonadaceae bacterium]|nr:MAG: Holliday junction branch migration protein RuvA [Halomonadaceae bacterium]